MAEDLIEVEASYDPAPTNLTEEDLAELAGCTVDGVDDPAAGEWMPYVAPTEKPKNDPPTTVTRLGAVGTQGTYRGVRDTKPL